MNRKAYVVRATDVEHMALKRLADRNNVTLGDMLRALIVDALYEEGILINGRLRQAGHPQATEGREAGGSPQQ